MRVKRVAHIVLASAVLCSTVLSAQTFTRGDPVPATLPIGNRPGNPLQDMPPGQRLISPFGERPVFSTKGDKLAFIGKSYGDAFEYDMATGQTRNITGHAPSEGYLRVHYMHDGSYALLGPRVPAKMREETRMGRIQLFWMNADASKPPVPLGVTVFEGIATSRISNMIAWSEAELDGNLPTKTTIHTGRIVVDQAGSRLTDVRKIISPPGCLVEAQDFLPGDKGLVMACYYFPNGKSATKVISVDFATRRLTEYPTTPGLYGEVEGIFPDGKRTLVECAQDRAEGMDLCVLDLNPEKPTYTRMTNVVQFGRWKYGNPVVRPDGRTIAAQIGSADVIDAGVGQGIILMDLANPF